MSSLIISRRRCWGQMQRKGFTLIELLVVLSVITLLVALLMPALSAAREAAQRAQCGSERRQLLISLFQWGNDYRDRVPTATGSADVSGAAALEPSRYVHMHEAHGFVTGMMNGVATNMNGGSTILPMGTLARKGYIGDPRLLFCPSWDRVGLRNATGATFGTLAKLFLDQVPSAWRELTRPVQAPAGVGLDGAASMMGISIHFAVAQRRTFNSTSRSMENVTFDWIRDNYRTAGTDAGIANANNHFEYGVSSILASCHNYSPYVVAATAVANNMVDGGAGLSHRGLGLNAGMIDGSTRWITQDQVRAGGWNGASHIHAGWNTGSTPHRNAAYLFNTQNNGSGQNNFHGWARRFDPF